MCTWYIGRVVSLVMRAHIHLGVKRVDVHVWGGACVGMCMCGCGDVHACGVFVQSVDAVAVA